MNGIHEARGSTPLSSTKHMTRGCIKHPFFCSLSSRVHHFSERGGLSKRNEISIHGTGETPCFFNGDRYPWDADPLE